MTKLQNLLKGLIKEKPQDASCGLFLPPPTAWGFLNWTRGPGEVLAENSETDSFRN